MIAVDTNILVRLIVGDDAAQVERARELAEQEPIFVSLTVLTETEWVLRSRYRYDRERIHGALTALPELVDVKFEDDEGVYWALDRFAIGGELADYLHIVAARGVGRFATFEKRLAGRAGPAAPSQIQTLA
ncbi:MAG: type II toxin-antitoxin system VapC family toxin [Sphingomonadales bacterium]